MPTVKGKACDNNEALNNDLERILLRLKEMTDSIIKIRGKYIIIMVTKNGIDSDV